MAPLRQPLLLLTIACAGLFTHCSSWGKFWDTAEITAFAIPARGITGIISGTRIALIAETYSTLAPEIATFTASSGRVLVGGVEQVSGVTANSFGETLVYTVISEGGFSRDYAVTLFAPKLIAGLTAWYRADALSLADAAPITSWGDSSDQANNLTSTFGGSPPQYRSGQLNGKPVARFIPSGGNGDGIGRSGASGFGGSSLATFIVLKHGAYNGVEQYILTLDNAGGCTNNGAGFAQILRTASFNLDISDPCASYPVSGSAFSDTSLFHILTSAYDSGTTSFRYFLDGNLILSTTAAISLTSISYIALGNYGSGVNNSFEGDIAEVIVYNAAIGESNRVKISCYLSVRYALPLSEACP